MTKQKKTTEIVSKIGIIACKNRDFFDIFSDAIMDVNFSVCFDMIFLDKNVQCDRNLRKIRYLLSRTYMGDFFATRFEDFLCVKSSLAERLLTRGKTRLTRSRLARIAA